MPRETIQSIISVIALVILFLAGLYFWGEYRQRSNQPVQDSNFAGPSGEPFTNGPNELPPGSNDSE